MSVLRNFINNNNLDFYEGNRNSNIVILIGYSQYLGLTKEVLEDELDNEIGEDPFISEEINRLWDYCKAKGYKNYWSKSEAKQQYTFE